MEAEARADRSGGWTQEGPGAVPPGPEGCGPGAGGSASPPTDPGRTAAAICRDVRLGLRARRLLEEGMKPGSYLAVMVEHRLYADAIRYMAHALLNREAVWWSCLCARSEVEALAAMPAGQREALGAAVRWVLEPTAVHRQEAGRAATGAGHLTPAGAAALAASFALGPAAEPSPNGPAASPPNPVQAARLVAGGVLLAAGRGPASAASARLRRFITLGLDVAYGHNRWD